MSYLIVAPKGKFETTAQFEDRKKATVSAASIDPITVEAEAYVSGIHYDADRERFEVMQQAWDHGAYSFSTFSDSNYGTVPPDPSYESMKFHIELFSSSEKTTG